MIGGIFGPEPLTERRGAGKFPAWHGLFGDGSAAMRNNTDQMSLTVSITAATTGDPGADFLGMLAGLEVADAVETPPWNVAEETPELCLRVFDLLAPLLPALVNLPDPVDFVVIEGCRCGGGHALLPS
jgi:hypothetical protein